jgi:gamma-glutamyltranspeptidase/glutathione hydrolase
MVATAHPYATLAAIEILQAGGNAVDAAVAAQWVLNVVEPQSSGIGGGGFFVYFEARTGQVHTFDGREKAPRRAFPEMFLDPSGKPLPFYPDRITGGLPVGVPGTLKLLERVHAKFGSGEFRFGELFQPAIRWAKEGVSVSRRLSETIRQEGGRLSRFEATRNIFFRPGGAPLREGDLLVQEELARTFETLAREGIRPFYEGEIARAIVEAVRNAPFHPGLLEMEDLRAYKTAEREVLRGSYRGYDLFTMGPPSSGGAALLEILNLLENFDLPNYGPASADSIHLILEAQKIAYEDRAKFLGDPDFTPVPLKKLLSKNYAKERVRGISLDRASRRETKVEEASLAAKSNTSHLSIRDSEGNIVSYTTTIEHLFGSGIVVPGWGFFLNNELTDFDTEPGRANTPGPEKRPRSSMTPVIVFRDGKPFLVAGSPGGSLIIPAVQEVLTRVLDFKMPLEDALALPRFAARNPEAVEAEPRFFDQAEIVKELKRRGHPFAVREPFGNVQAIRFEGEGKIVGASDPRGEGEALGY